MADDGADAGWLWPMATVTGTDGDDFIHQAGDGHIDRFPDTYHEIIGSTSGPDVIDGGAGHDIIYGGDGDDVVHGGPGVDDLYDGAGTDSLYADGDGAKFWIEDLRDIDGLAEHIEGGGGFSAILFNSPGGYADLTKADITGISYLEVGHPTGESIEILMTPSQLEEFNVEVFADVIRLAGPANLDLHPQQFYFNELILSDNSDSLSIATSDEYGETPIAEVYGGGGNDTITLDMPGKERHSSYVRLLAIDGGDGNDVLHIYDGMGTLTGDKGRDDLKGGKLNDSLSGGSGNDILTGAGSGDELSGGGGADLFVYDDVRDSRPDDGKSSRIHGTKMDMIADFNHAQGDRIDLFAIDADTTQDGNQAFHLLAEGAFSGHAGDLIQTIDDTGNTLLQGDVNGDGQADFAISLSHAPLLVVADLVL